MVIKSNLINYFFYLIKSNLLFSLVILYEFNAIIINWLTDIDIRIPCLFVFFFEIECIGCGLSRAFEYILDLNFSDAFETNFLIFPVILGALIFIITDYKKFKINYK